VSETQREKARQKLHTAATAALVASTEVSAEVDPRQLAARIEQRCFDSCRQSVVIYLSLLNSHMRKPLAFAIEGFR
jgi:hypothetical protein